MKRISAFFNQLITHHPSLTKIADQRKARLSSSLSLALSAFLLIGAFSTYIINRDTKAALVTFIIPFLISFTAYIITKTKYYNLGAFLFIIGFCSSAFINIIVGQREIRVTLLFYIPLGLIFANAILNGWENFLLIGLIVFATLLLPLFGIPLPDNIGGPLGLISTISGILFLLANYRNSLEFLRIKELEQSNQDLQTLSTTLESRVTERTHQFENASQQAIVRAAQLQAIAEISQAIVLEQSMEKLLPLISRLISEKFGYYHVGVFIINNDGYAVLRAANSDGGKQLVARGHKLRVGAKGLVGYVGQQGSPRIALDVEADVAYFQNPELPNTLSEVALPLKIGDKIIGVLDVQSTQASAFTNEDIDILSTLANQVGTSIQNAQLFEKIQDALSGYIRASQQDWKRISRKDENSGYSFKPDGSLQKIEYLEASAQQKFDTKDFVLDIDQNKQTLSVPVRIRDQIIGIINIQADDPNRDWSDNEISLVKTISDRAAFALENARLFEDAGRRAHQEQMISSLSATISSSTDFDRIMQITIEELGRTLGATRTFIQLDTTANGSA